MAKKKNVISNHEKNVNTKYPRGCGTVTTLPTDKSVQWYNYSGKLFRCFLKIYAGIYFP